MCDSTGFFVYNYSSVNTDMGKDKRGISQGKCSICECEEYESSALRCDYCGHTPINHLPFGSEPKRPRTEEPQLEENEVVENPSIHWNRSRRVERRDKDRKEIGKVRQNGTRG